MDFAIVDLQGFKNDSNDFIVKEVSVITKNLRFNEIIKPLCEFENLSVAAQTAANWLTFNYHGFKWNDGYITVSELVKTIDPILKDKIIFVKGEEKVRWLQTLMDSAGKKNPKLPVINMESIGCDLNLRKSITTFNRNFLCSKHRKMTGTYACALQNVMELMLWYSHYLKKNN